MDESLKPLDIVPDNDDILLLLIVSRHDILRRAVDDGQRRQKLMGYVRKEMKLRTGQLLILLLLELHHQHPVAKPDPIGNHPVPIVAQEQKKTRIEQLGIPALEYGRKNPDFKFLGRVRPYPVGSGRLHLKHVAPFPEIRVACNPLVRTHIFPLLLVAQKPVGILIVMAGLIAERGKLDREILVSAVQRQTTILIVVIPPMTLLFLRYRNYVFATKIQIKVISCKE